jgi:hypothetical protein
MRTVGKNNSVAIYPSRWRGIAAQVDWNKKLTGQTMN